MGYIDCREDVDGNILIKLEGMDYVKADSINEIALDYDEVTGFYTPYWKQLANVTTVNGITNIDITGAEVYNMTQTISTDTNTDIGSLKSMLFARGNKRGTHKDLEDADKYNREISQSIMMNVQAEFDRLINRITTSINEVLKAAADSEPASSYMKDSDGNAYTIFNTMTGETNKDAFTVENLIINGEIKQAPSLLGFKKDDGTIDQATADALKEIFSKAEHTLNPNVKTTTNFINYYNNLISQVANTGSVLRGISETQQMTVDNTAAAREQILGVSSDEELSNMIMFQNAYNASSRYINVISELLEHIISTLGR